MKKQLNFWLAAFLMFCGAGQAPAAEKTVKFDFSNTDQITTNTTSKVVWTVEDATFSINSNMSGNVSNPLRLYATTDQATYKGSIYAGADQYFTSVVVYAVAKYVPTTDRMTWENVSVSSDGNVVTLTPDGDDVQNIGFTTIKQVRLDSIVCTLSSACTAPDEALAITPAAVSLEVGESLKFTAKGGNGASVAYASSDDAVVSVSADGLITALRKGTATITATQAKEGEYCSQSVEVPVTVAESYTVTWQTPTGSTTSKVEKGTAIGAAYPTGEVATCDAAEFPHFAGWITENVGKEGSMEVTFVTASTVPAADVTYYAAFADESKAKGDDFACEGSLASLTNNGGSHQNCESYASGSYAIKMATDGAYITVPVANPETATFKYNRRGGAVTASVELQYALDNATFTTLETWDVSGATTTNVITLTNSKPFPQGTINVRFLYKRSSGNIAVGPISVTAGTDFPAATVFVTACCDAWTVVPTVNVDKTTLDGDANETLSVTAVSGVPEGYTGAVSYMSSNPLVATVNAATGAATAQNAGTFRVMATWSGDAAYCDNSAKSDEITVTGKVSLSYDKNCADATGDMPTQKFDVNAQVTLAACQFERTGYHFVGWAEKADGAKLWNDVDEVILTGNKQLYAVWEINVYNVEKGAEKHGKFTLSAATVEHGGRIVVTKKPAANYKNGTVSVVPADAATVDNDTVKDITGDITINVAFEEKTKYAMTWHSGNATATTWVYEGNALGALPKAESSCDAANHPNFYGWCATEYGSHTAPKTEAPTLIDVNLKPTGDADFYAVYSNFVMGGGEKMTTLAVGDQVLMVAVDSMELGGISDKNIGTAVKYDGAPNGVYPLNVVAGAADNSFAFEHDGKYLSYPAGSGNALYETDAIDNASSWTVSFDGENAAVANVSSSSRQIYYNKANPRFACYSSAQMPIQLVRAGRPTEWMTTCCTPIPFEVRDTTLLLEDVVDATATVDVALLVSGNGNGGEKAYHLAENYDGVTLSGSTFASSHVGKFTAVVSQETQGDVCGNEYEIVITVEPKNSTITFEANADGVTGTMDPMNAETLTKQTLTPNAFVKVGHHFVEWNTQADGSGTAFADGAEVEMHDMVLYAQWEINKYPVTVVQTGEGDVTLPTEVQHGGSFEVVATPAVGSKLVEITVTPAENATLEGNTVQNVVGDITVSVTFEALAQFKVVYRDAENAAILSETVYEGSFANPDLSQFGCERMPLAGFSNTQVADNSETFEAVDVKTAVIDRDTTFWAVYALYKGAARRFNPATTQSGDFTIYADVDGVAKFATGSLSSGKYTSTENADEANIYTFEQVSAGVYTIKRGDKYVNYKSSTDLEEKATFKTWTISQGEKGSWRVADTATPARALLFNNGAAKFGGYAVINIGNVGYFDIEIGNSVAPRYFSTLDCATTDVTGVNLASLDTVCVGETKTLVAEVLPADATDKSVVWSSGNSAVATVDAATGEVKGLSQGIAVITVTTNDEGYTASCQLFVRQPVAEISLQETSLNLKDCEAGQLLHATVLPADATNKLVRWSSNDELVATVDALGFVRPVALGNAVITATTVDGGFTAECAVTVAECVKVASLTLDTATLEFKTCENKNYQLKATVLPENAENKALLWESSDPRVAVVVAGLVTPVSAGTATISATTTDGTELKAVCAVTVTDCEDALENVAALDGVFVRDGRIVVEQGSPADVRVYNALGQTVALQTDVMAFELSVPQGVYVVVVGDKSQKVVVK